MRDVTDSRNRRSWLMTRKALVRFFSSCSSQRIPSKSKWFVGSSMSNTSGSSSKAWVMANRLRQPPGKVWRPLARRREGADAEGPRDPATLLVRIVAVF